MSEPSVLHSRWRTWGQFVLWAAIVNACALALIWAWRESATRPTATNTLRSSAASDAIQIRLAPTTRVDTEPLPSSPAADLAVRAIESELADLGSAHAWAGKYFDCSEPGGHRELWIAPSAGFALAPPGEMGSSATMFGSVHAANGLLELVPSPKSVDGIDDAPEPPTHLVPVVWSGRHHLVEPKYWQRWSNFAKRERPAEYEPHNYDRGSFWLRAGEELGDHSGPSQPPLAYREAWSKRLPIHVVKVGVGQRQPNSSVYSTTLELDAGAHEGIVVGMRLFVDEMPDRDRPVRVVTVREHWCTASLDQDLQDARVPVSGWTCSTLPKLE